MEKVGKVGPKNMGKNIRVEELLWEMFLVISRCRKSLVMSAPKPENLWNYFGHLLVCLYDRNVFWCEPGI